MIKIKINGIPVSIDGNTIEAKESNDTIDFLKLNAEIIQNQDKTEWEMENELYDLVKDFDDVEFVSDDFEYNENADYISLMTYK